MSKRESVEGRITTYFQTADVLEAVLMFKVIKSILLSRGFELDGRKTAQKKSKEPKAAGKKIKEDPKGNSETDAGLGLSTN